MEHHEIKRLVVETMREVREEDPAYRWIVSQMDSERERKIIYDWVAMQIAREKERHETFRKVKESTLGHLAWIILVVVGTAIYQWVVQHLRR